MDNEQLTGLMAEVTSGPPQHEEHSHCCKCGAEARMWKEETSTWWCDRCSKADDHDTLSKWFLENLDTEIKDGGLAVNVIRLLFQQDDIPNLP